MLKKLLRLILIYDSHELESQKAGFDKEPRWLRLLTRRLEHLLIGRADYVITVGDFIADYLTEQDAIQRPFVIRNIPEIPPVDLTKHHSKHFGFSLDYHIVLFQGGLQVWRGLENLITAISYLPTHIILILIGDGPRRQYLETIVAKFNLCDRILFKGWVSPDVLLEYTAQADLGIMPSENVSLSYYFGLPSKFFEYIAAGIPIIASDFPELKKIITNYQIGELFNPSEPTDIAKAIQTVLQSKEYHSTLKKNLTKAQKIFTWEKEKMKLVNLYDTL